MNAALLAAGQIGRLLQCGCCAGNQHQIQTRLGEQ
jgi:hypothetical protein